MSYRGRKQGNYGDSQRPRRSSSPLYYKRGITRKQNGYALSQYGPEGVLPNQLAPQECAQQSQTQGEDANQTQPQDLELWLNAAPSLTFPSGLVFKFSPNSKDLRKDAEALVKLPKKKLLLEIHDPKTKKTIKAFRILKRKDFEKEQAQKPKAEMLEAPLTEDMEATQDIMGYFQGLREELGKLGFVLVAAKGEAK